MTLRGPDLPDLHPADCRSRARSRAGREIFAAALTALLGVLAATVALAQKNPSPQNQGPPNALQGFSQNRDQPVKIQSDGLVVRDKDKIATFTGNVHVFQGDTEMRSKVLVVYYVDSNKPGPAPATTMKTAPPGAPPGSSDQQQIRRIEATGGVVVTQKDQITAGDSGTFDMQSNTVTLNGNVVVTRGKDVLRGQRLVVDLNTGVSRMDGGRVDALFGSPPSGGSPPGGEGNPPGSPPRPTRAN
jgi:lipopolysaccharide export system protein LptA